MSTFILDTSVAVAWYINETFSPSARVWLDRLMTGKVTLLVPSLHYWEFANVLRTLVSRNDLEEKLARETYQLHLDAPLEISEPNQKMILSTAFQFRATAYDAVYISLCLSRNVPLITAERTTTPWVSKLGKRIEAVR